MLADRHSDGHGSLCLTGTAEIALAGKPPQRYLPPRHIVNTYTPACSRGVGSVGSSLVVLTHSPGPYAGGVGLVSQTTVSTPELPIRMVGFNHAFREEAGGAGASTRGLYVLAALTCVLAASAMFPVSTICCNFPRFATWYDVSLCWLAACGSLVDCLPYRTGSSSVPWAGFIGTSQRRAFTRSSALLAAILPI